MTSPLRAMKRRSILVFVAACLLALLLTTQLYFLAKTRTEFFVTYDFLAYHASFQLFAQGLDPYNPEKLLAIQQTQSYVDHDLPAQMRYPPWTYPLLAPILCFKLETAAILWMLCNLGLMISASVLVWRGLYPRQNNLIPAILSGCLFVPNIEALAWNQVSLLVAFGAAGLVWSLSRKRDLLAGLCLSLLSIKFHMFLPLGIYLLFLIFTEKRFTMLWSFIASILSLSAISLCVSPHILSDWITWSLDRTNDVPVPTLVGVLRYYAFTHTGEIIDWPIFVIPLATASGLAIWLRRKKTNTPLTQGVLLVLCLSLFSAPFANIHDLSILLAAQVAVWGWLNPKEIPVSSKVKGLSLLIAINLFGLVLLTIDPIEDVNFAWVSLALLLFYGFRKQLFPSAAP